MKLSSKRVRLRSMWVLVPLYLIFARPSPPLLWPGLVLAVAGAALRTWAAGVIRKKKELATGGPYAYTRNPLYLGTFLIGTGLAVAGGRLSFVVAFFVLFGIIYGWTMRAEERDLYERFGREYDAYARSVPLFVPRVTPYRPPEPPSTRFDIQRYLNHQEYQAAVGVLIGFLVLAAKMFLDS